METTLVPPAGACRGMRCEAAVSPTISATPFSPTVSATPKILTATPEFEEFETIVYTSIISTEGRQFLLLL